MRRRFFLTLPGGEVDTLLVSFGGAGRLRTMLVITERPTWIARWMRGGRTGTSLAIGGAADGASKPVASAAHSQSGGSSGDAEPSESPRCFFFFLFLSGKAILRDAARRDCCENG